MKKYAVLLIMIIFLPRVIKAQMIFPKIDLGNGNYPISTVLFTPNSKYLIAGGFLKVYDLETGSEVIEPDPIKDVVNANVIVDADISNNGKYIAMRKAFKLDIFDLESRMPHKTVRGQKAAVAFGPDNKTLAYLEGNGDLVFHNLETGNESKHSPGKIKPNKLAWSNSGRYIAIGGRRSNVFIFDVEKKQTRASLNMSGSYVQDIEFSEDSRYLAIASRSGHVTLVETESGDIIRSWSAHNGQSVFTVAFHPSGLYLATGGADNMIKIWEVPSCEQVKSWKGHDNKVTALDFSPDGAMLASGCFNTIIGGTSDTRVWDVADTGIPTRFAQAEDNIAPDLDEAVVQEEVEAVSENLQAAAAAEQKRLALVIGNGIYTYGGVLANPENDANDIGSSLQRLGFDVMVFNNLGLSDFKKAIDDFGFRLAGYDVGLFYYAGHGIQVKGNNYLIPIDANLRTENDVEYDCVNAGRLLAKMEDAGSTTNIIILDACRDNPFERSWRRATHGMGLAFMTAPAGSLISYATSPGATASDGSGRNGLFTSALLNYINEPGLSILEMFQKVRTYVREQSGGEQVPWESTSLEGNFYFK